MPLAIDDLIDPPTEDEIFETFLDTLESFDIPARSWRKAGVARTILRVVAKTYSGFGQVISEAIRSGFLETARGQWLTLLARNVFNVERREASFASGKIRLVNGGGGIFSFAPDAARFLWESKNKAYVNSEAFTLNPGDDKLVAIRAVEAGSASSAPPDEIQKIETTMLGVTATNPAAVVGSDAEPDEELRAACKNKLGAISVRGPRSAYAFAVRSATLPDLSPVNVNRFAISPSSSTGVVTVTVASPSGSPTVEDIAGVEDAIETYARPDSVTADVRAATERALSQTFTVWAKRTEGVSAPEIQTFVEDALVKAIANYPIGGIPKPPSTQGYLYADFLSGTVLGAHSSIYDVDGSGEDIALDPDEVVTLAATVNVRVVEVP